MITELLSRAFLKLKIFVHKILNRSVYKKGVILYGVPRMIYRERISLAKDVKINENTFLHGAGGITIGENTTLSYGTTILTTGYDTASWSEGKVIKDHIEQGVIIGKNVWIGANATILDGVSIPDDSIIGAGSIVTKSLPDAGHVYAGVPAKKIKEL